MKLGDIFQAINFTGFYMGVIKDDVTEEFPYICIGYSSNSTFSHSIIGFRVWEYYA